MQFVLLLYSVVFTFYALPKFLVFPMGRGLFSLLCTVPLFSLSEMVHNSLACSRKKREGTQNRAKERHHVGGKGEKERKELVRATGGSLEATSKRRRI